MVGVWWPLLAAAIPSVVAGQAFRIKRRRNEEQRLKVARGREKSSDEVFVYERVCCRQAVAQSPAAKPSPPNPSRCRFDLNGEEEHCM
ncbi:hypothetical protein GUJ93_ZPchr0011g28071 [Zizania palustris]|uniref:Secreted protein n=1 Tax=Zizania palustris TaxID=103762 RepID=A0A8J5WGB6_ZIZPA|nr:hypothetical protein GUJ93_ZPchr0011g28071 [Zizania palustris]